MTVAVRVIPCLDVDAGRVVKGVNFTDLRDAGDRVEMARVYDAEGADELTFLDITASSSGRETTYDVVRRTVRLLAQITQQVAIVQYPIVTDSPATQRLPGSPSGTSRPSASRSSIS